MAGQEEYTASQWRPGTNNLIPRVAKHFQKLTPNAKKGWEYLLQQSSEKAVGNENQPRKLPLDDIGSLLNTLETPMDFEYKYDKPDNFVVLSRQPFPQSNSEPDWHDCARWNLPVGASKEQMDQYVELMKTVRESMKASFKSKLTVYHTDVLKKEHKMIMADKKQAVTLPDMQKHMLHEVFTKEDCEIYFQVQFGSLERNNYFAMKKIVLEVLLLHHIWYDPVNNAVNRNKGNKSLKQCNVTHYAWVVERDTFRNPYTRKDNNRHGVKIGTTRDKDAASRKQGKRAKRKPGEFIWEDCVRGYGTDKHLQWMADVVSGNIHKKVMQTSC